MPQRAVKTAITYQDRNGHVQVKNCGTSDSVRECISWLKRKGFMFLSKETIIHGSALMAGTRKAKAR